MALDNKYLRRQFIEGLSNERFNNMSCSKSKLFIVQYELYSSVINYLTEIDNLLKYTMKIHRVKL